MEAFGDCSDLLCVGKASGKPNVWLQEIHSRQRAILTELPDCVITLTNSQWDVDLLPDLAHRHH